MNLNNNIAFKGGLFARAYGKTSEDFSYSSAPNITKAEHDVDAEMQRLKKMNVTTVKELTEGKYRPEINKDGLFTTCGLPYTGVLKNADGALVEYKDGKPVTIVKSIANGNQINKKIVKYEYPEGSIAALRTETNIIQETNHSKGYSYSVPSSILKEAGMI